MSGAALPRATIAGLSVTQIIGWGSTYYIPSVLAAALRSSLGLSPELVFGGVSVMLLVSAAVAPRAGRIMQARGVRGPMILGSAVMAAGLIALSQAQGLWTYALAWLVIGLAAPIALTQAAMSALAQIAGADARRAMGTLLLFSGFSSAVFWPLTAWLEARLGWRETCLVFAGLHLLICCPLQALVIPTLTGRREARVAPGPQERLASRLPPGRERLAMALVALAFSLGGFVSWGLPLQLVAILTAFGHPAATAVSIGALMGPAQVAARIGEVTLGQRADVLRIGLVATALMPFVVALPLIESQAVWVAIAFVVGYGLSAGTMTVVRSVLPLVLFGPADYARLLGRLALPQNTAFALSPTAYAAVMSAAGPRGALVLSCLGAALALAAMIGLNVAVGRSPETG